MAEWIIAAIDDQAQAFYQRFGFVPLLDRPLHLCLPLATIAEAFGGPSQG